MRADPGGFSVGAPQASAWESTLETSYLHDCENQNMPITTILLEFLLNLLRDPEAAAEFRADPEAVLESAGLSEVTPDDVDACMPVVLDYAPVDYAPVIGDREYNAGGNSTSGNGGNSGSNNNTPGSNYTNRSTCGGSSSTSTDADICSSCSITTTASIIRC